MSDKVFDELDAMFNEPRPAGPVNVPALVEGPIYTDTCPKCRGSGVFRSYTGRVVGACFTCNGSKVVAFKTPAQVRARARVTSAARVARKGEEATQAFAVAHPALWTWIESRPDFGFAVSMREAIQRYGSLTDNQFAAVERCAAGDADRAKVRADRQAACVAVAPAVEVGKVEAAFTRAKAAGLTRPFLLFDTFKFSLAKADSRNAGAVYVKDQGTREYLGKIQGGRFLKVYACTPDQEARIVSACNDPAKAAEEYGKRTGSCSCCGRTLTNAESIARGIGPICAGKFGF